MDNKLERRLNPRGIVLGLVLVGFIVDLRVSCAQWTSPVQLNILADPSIKTWPSINVAGDTLYYAKWGANGDENLCYSYRIADTTWSAPIFMPAFINTQYPEISPSIGPGDSTLYFVSFGRPGGYGSYDIWFTRRDSLGQWMEPENVGANINTAGMEWGVFLSRDGQKLYFSSTRHAGWGLDIFVSQWGDSGWGEAVRLPGQLNWVTDEENVTLASDESYLVLTSERASGWGTDLLRSDLVDSAWSWPLPLTELNDVGHENGATLSPDGLTIYFASDRVDSLPGASQLYVSHWTDAASPPATRIQTQDFRLAAYPNPFNPSTTISFSLPQRERVSLQVYDLLGREVQKLDWGMMEAGNYQRSFSADLPSGVYVMRLNAGERTAVKKMILIR